MFPIIRRVSLIFALALTTSMAFADSIADEAWKKVEDAMKSLENPANPPKSREEAVAHLKSGLTAFDSSLKDFSTSAPSDARRWQAKIFEAKTANARGFAGLPPSSDMSAILDEIVNSSDAPQAIKGEASGMNVLVGVKKMPEDEWQKKAEQHLQTYPEAPMNPQIKSMIDRVAVMAKLKTQPLDLKFTALDVATTRSKAHRTKTAAGKTNGVSRMNDTAREAGVSPRSSLKFKERTPKTMPTTTWPPNFALARRPMERRLKILM